MSGAKIIEGLREAVAGKLASVLIDGQHWVRVDSTVEAEITRLRAQVERMRKALGPFNTALHNMEVYGAKGLGDTEKPGGLLNYSMLRLGDFRAARAAMEG